MQWGVWFYVVAGFWGVAVVANLIQAATICYQIEARSGRPMMRSSGLPGYANIIPVAFNVRVAQDDETQALRWQMNKRLLIILGGFVAFYFFTMLVGPGAEPAAG